VRVRKRQSRKPHPFYKSGRKDGAPAKSARFGKRPLQANIRTLEERGGAAPEKTLSEETEEYNSRFLSAQADAFTGSERRSEGRPAPFGMTVAGRCESIVGRCESTVDGWGKCESTVRNVKIRSLRKGGSAASRLWSCLGRFLRRALSARRTLKGAAAMSAYTSSASGWMSSLPLVFLAIR
jgi:hypothetical protein